MKARDIILRPVVTEKGNHAREVQNVVTLAVNPRANKHQIRSAVEEIFEVKVAGVRTMRMPRKLRRRGRFVGRRPEWKKAIVVLAEGQAIEFFEGV